MEKRFYLSSTWKKTILHHLMATTVPRLPKVVFRCRKHITNETLNSICLIDNKHNPADAMTKLKSDNSLELCVRCDFYEVPVKRTFELQQSMFRYAKFISTALVPMTEDHYSTWSHPPFTLSDDVTYSFLYSPLHCFSFSPVDKHVPALRPLVYLAPEELHTTAQTPPVAPVIPSLHCQKQSPTSVHESAVKYLSQHEKTHQL